MRIAISTILTLGLLAALVGLPGTPLAARDDRGLDDESLARIQAAAKKIDQLIEADLRRNGQSPNPVADDATFLRRAYLSIIGRIPTAEEAEDFLRGGGRRAQLIDRLLASKGHDSHMFNWWADLLRIKSRITNQVSGEPYIHFIKDSIAQNKPYDRFVHDLITAEGPAYARDNGATGYYLRDRGMPEDNMANTVRTFLGTRLECAQCHDHPFDKWTQKEFFEMVAFTGGIQYRSNAYSPREQRRMRQAQQQIRRELGEQAYRSFRRGVFFTLAFGVTGNGTGLSRLPHDYQYDNAKPNDWIRAQTMFGEEVSLDAEIPREPRRLARRMKNNPRLRQRLAAMAKPIDSRTAYADWLTSAETPRFTRTIANRMWKKAMGLGLVEPVDTMMDGTVPSNPELMAYLEKLMVDLGFDLEQFQRVLFNTKTWQRRAARTEPMAGETYRFPGPLLRRLTAEQVWDSMLTLLVPNLDETLADPGARAEPMYAQYEKISNMSLDEIIEGYKQGDYTRQRNPQRMRQERQKKQRELVAKARPLIRQLRRAQRRDDKRTEKELLAKLAELGWNPSTGFRRPNQRGGMVRASDQRMPAQPGHFLRQFGQSDRDQIQASHTEATVPQVLALLNGFVEQQVVARQGSVLMQSIANAPNAGKKIRAAYLSLLNRLPSSSETAMWKRDFQRNETVATRDLVWTLVNTHEFRFLQ